MKLSAGVLLTTQLPLPASAKNKTAHTAPGDDAASHKVKREVSILKPLNIKKIET